MLESPLEYYTSILEGCRFAKFRVLMSTLYLGTGVLENYLIDELNKNVIKNNQLQVRLYLFDL